MTRVIKINSEKTLGEGRAGDCEIYRKLDSGQVEEFARGRVRMAARARLHALTFSLFHSAGAFPELAEKNKQGDIVIFGSNFGEPARVRGYSRLV